MKLAKEAVSYYVDVTGQPWSTFYDKLDDAMSANLSEQSGELWLIHSLMNVVIKNGMSIHDFKSNKDAVKAVFDDEGRKLNGEFFTPVVWAEEFHRYLDKHIPGWREGYYVWENSCYDMATEIYTRRGWKTFDQLREDDEIYTFGRECLNGEWSGFHNLFKKRYTGKMIHFRGQGVDLLVTPDHQMLCKYRGDEYELISADALHQIMVMVAPKGVEVRLAANCEESYCGGAKYLKAIMPLSTDGRMTYKSEVVSDVDEMERLGIRIGARCVCMRTMTAKCGT